MIPLSKYSDDEVDQSLRKLVRNERKILQLILEHINEVDARTIYIKYDCADVYEYLIQEMKYTGSAADRRIAAARLLREVPAVSEMIETGSLNLSQICELKKAINEKERSSNTKISSSEKQQLLESIINTSVAETQKILAQALDIKIKASDKTRVQKDESVRIEITLTKEQYTKLMKCRDKAAHKLSQKRKGFELGNVIEVTMDKYLDEGPSNPPRKKNSKKPEDRTTTDKSQRPKTNIDEKSVVNISPQVDLSATDDQDSLNAIMTNSKLSFSNNQGESESAERINSCPENNNKTSEDEQRITNTVSTRENKTVTPKTRLEILKRDECCQYKYPSGKICGRTFMLQADHITSQWADGDHSSENLQALCALHNQLKYKIESGFVNLNK